MGDELLLIFVNQLVESIKQGESISTQSVASNVKELLKAIDPAKPLTPAQRHAIAADRHIEDICKERDRMATELTASHESHAIAIRELRRELTLVIDSHRERLDWLEPHYEGLKRDYDNIKSLNFPAFLMITLGTVVIGVASLIPWDVAKFSALAAGLVFAACGLGTQWLVIHKSPPSKERLTAK